MISVSIASALPGQVLARPVLNPEGAVLCPTGLRLNEATIERLKAAGVTAVTVEGVDAAGPSLQERLDALETRFRDIDDPLMLQLKATIERRLRLIGLGHEPR